MSVARWPGTPYGPIIEIGYPATDLPCEYQWDCAVWDGEIPEPPAADLFEPFDNYTDNGWVLNGPPAIVAGRTGTAAQPAAASTWCAYPIPALLQGDTITLGFAFRWSDSGTTERDVVQFRGNTSLPADTMHWRLRLAPATGTLLAKNAPNTVTWGSASSAALVRNAWNYVELRAVLHDTSGSVVVRLNETEIINVAGLDTKPSAPGTYDQVRFVNSLSATTHQIDDLYLTMGPAATFLGDITLPLAATRVPVEDPGRWGPPWDWRNIECDVRAGSNIVRGSSSPSQRASSSTCSLSITPRDNTLAPWWIDPATGARPNRANLPLRVGVVELDVDVDVGVRVSEDGTARTLEDLAGRRSEAATPVAASTTTAWLFTGWIDYITEVDGVDELSLTIVASDGWKHLALLDQEEVAPVGAGEAAGSRIARILERAEWQNPSDLSLGTFALQATTLARPALEEIFLTADTEAGVVWVDASGTFRFGDRDWLASKSARTDWRIGDRHDDPDAICASSIVTTADDMDIQNVIGVARVGGVASWTEDPDSIARYGRHSWSRFDLPYASDDDTPTILALQLGDRTARDFHAQAVVLAPLTEPDAWECVLGVDLYDTVYLTRRRGDDHRAELGGVIGVDHSFGPNEFVTVLSLGPPLRQTLAAWDVDVWDTARWSGN